MFAEVAAPGRLQDGRLLRVGVAVGGLVDTTHGVVRTLHHAHGWDNFPLQEYLEEKLDVPCIIDNNANAVALAKYSVEQAPVSAMYCMWDSDAVSAVAWFWTARFIMARHAWQVR